MRVGQEIVMVEYRPDGRRAYLCKEGRRVQYRCLRRSRHGWCQFPSFGPCGCHQNGDAPPVESGVSYQVLGQDLEMPDGYEFVGYIPGKVNTYFIRMPSGIIRPACLRRRSLAGRVRSIEQGKSGHPFCLRHPIKVDGRYRGGCRQHKGGGIPHRATAFRNTMDPKFLSLVDRAAKSHPAIEQLQQRLDTITYAWYTLLEAIVLRDNLLEENPDLPRSTGIEAIIGAAGNVRDATKIQSRQQAEIFRVTGKVWAQQAYSLRLAQVLAQAAEPEGKAATERIGKRMKAAMIRRGLISGNRELPAINAPQAPDERTSDMELVVEGFRARNVQELDILTALHQTRKAKEYVVLVEAMGERVLSLYPLITILDNVITVETASSAPITVRNKIVRARNKAMEAQALIETALHINLTERQAKEIGESMIEAVMDAIEDERPAAQQRILERFMELKDEVEMPSRADGAFEIVVEALKEARL